MGSEHPIGQALATYAEDLIKDEMETSQVQDQNISCQNFENIVGEGVIGQFTSDYPSKNESNENNDVAIGNRVLLKRLQITLTEEINNFMNLQENQGRTAVAICINKKLAAVASITDKIKEEAPAVINYLQNQLKIQVV